MASSEQKTPVLRLPTPAITDSNMVRVGGGVITAEFPLLLRPIPEIARRGTVRLGGGVIAANFPL